MILLMMHIHYPVKHFQSWLAMVTASLPIDFTTNSERKTKSADDNDENTSREGTHNSDGPTEDEIYENEDFKNQVVAAVDSSALGEFHVADVPRLEDGPQTLTPAELGRQELYTDIPFHAVHGLQTKERAVTQSFAQFAAELDAAEQMSMGSVERDERAHQVSMVIEQELEFEAKVVTIPLITAVIAAALSQFLVGYK
jgi:hypothetical protein